MDKTLLLSEAAAALWGALAQGGRRALSELVMELGVDQSQLMVAAGEGEAEGWIEVETLERHELTLTEEGKKAIDEGLPERRALSILQEASEPVPMGELVARCQALSIPINEVFRWGGRRGWVKREKRADGVYAQITELGRSAVDRESPDERCMRAAFEESCFIESVLTEARELKEATGLLARKELSRLKTRKIRQLKLTEAGQARWNAGVKILRERNALSHEELKSGAWREVTLRPYDVTLPAASVHPARLHPVRKIIEQTRQAFLELGFEEVVSPSVEGAFWNFDALFQPQDHPARDMQDTFYMADPAQAPLPSAARVDAVRHAHESGERYGSTGWGYQWRPEEAQKTVLRTHTTASTIRALARNPGAPYKAFCVGWTYRNESISYKHLPVFHQVDGIVIDEKASLASLLGILSAFYQKMGFSKVRFKPAFYPYTEPSVDVMVYMESRKKWIEMGGSGVFRPEVTRPLGCEHPVLAWGLGIERLAMLRLGFDDIRHLYQGGLDTIEGVPLCR
ncbi:MAG: phenylalanine--tRNA ligase subunit alpha [Myxococcota bacterium]|nr:phenylalanine--tRNA ligase subunit alpha [Myxococcota bacterium]